MQRFDAPLQQASLSQNAVRKNLSNLVLTLQHHTKLTAKLEHMGNDRFLCTYNLPLWGIKAFPFTIQDGEVKSFVLSVADFLEYTTYDFKKK